MDVKLIAVSPKGTRKEFPLVAAVTTLGRHLDCDLKIQIGQISRQHCQLMLEDSEVAVKDLGSGNGTFVNGKKVQQQNLNAGDIVSLGDAVRFLIQIDGHPEEIDDSKLRQRTKAAAAVKKQPPKEKPKPVHSDTAFASTSNSFDNDEADQLLGESFFMDMDEDEDEGS